MTTDLRRSNLFNCLRSGFVAAACNVLNIVVVISSRDLLRKYVYFVAFNFCELLNGMFFLFIVYFLANASYL
ncbi:hypothetical protein Y032_0005g2479 [Ancylostoma ceylanicum]|uniref:7TM GPCR serpentine receptor class x (Srx) domain-containing protein n=1 Tax=Ancylostoma ceylanicum TaxID=53326 RepID=A0A016VRG4_9BILA|nr:hypothetical protein Y032_0005g2479 [Ancylostoma ceylanicum]